jgi:hypothetical protein
MMGKKTPREIREGILAAFKKARLDPKSWLSEQIAMLERGTATRPVERETLQLLRDGLQEPVAKKPRHKKKSTQNNRTAGSQRKRSKSRTGN